MSRDQVKAGNYIQQLDEARCAGNWDAVPELVRKIRKHAPQRTCLTITAESEYAVIQAARNDPSTGRPSTARPTTTGTAGTSTSATSSHNSILSRNIPSLLEAVEKEATYRQDEFQAQVCLGWVHWQLGEFSLAAARLPKNIEEDFAQLDGTKQESAEWTKICAVKASYLKANSQGRMGAITDALETYESTLPVIAGVSASPQQGRELRHWIELYLTGFAMLSSHAVKSKMSSILETETLSVFRAWAKFWEFQSPTPTGGKVPQAEASRRQVWKEYYITLSDVLQQNLPFPTTSLTTAYAETSTRLQQRAELKRVEAKYESLLLSEVQFPKAADASEEVEAFVTIVIQNWRVLCGNEHDLGEGGAEAISRGVLDILYRAATKTFHSTPILRHLFTVHLAVAEFELAFKAFDTYMDIVKKGKARVAKTGGVEHGLDDDETVLRTASECIKALCRYGSRQGAEQAKELGHFFEDWLNQHHPDEQPSGNGRLLHNGRSMDLGTTVAPKIFAMAWRCIGIGHAQWARLTYDASSRSDIQLKAIQCFRKSLSPQYESTTDVATLFALGVVLAERRELAAAVEVVKSGLLPRSFTAVNALDSAPGNFSRERSLIPLWHLMALLLSARQEFTTAARSCEGAFEQFQDPHNLFGDSHLDGEYRSAHLNENHSSGSKGVVDDMDDFEKESVLEVKMTQLALIEVLEGPEVAVNASDELLSLYSRLFGDPTRDPSIAIVPSTPSAPPKSSAGTLRSMKGSIFGRTGRSIRKQHTGSVSASTDRAASATMPRPQTMTSTRAPTIHVTNENGTAKSHTSHHHEKLQKRSESVSRKGSRNRSTSAATSQTISTATAVDGEKFFTPPAESDERDEWLNNESGGQIGVAVSPKNPSTTYPRQSILPPKSQKLAYKEPALKSTHEDISITQDNRLPQAYPFSYSINPITRFPADQQRRRRKSVLIKCWLLISGFYRRALMYDDAKGTIEEAEKLVVSIESEVSKDATGSVSIDDPGWSGGKCVGELWADIFCERGYLAVAENAPYLALAHFESALTQFPDHPSAIVGLSNILLDVYTEDLLPPPSMPSLVLPGPLGTPSATSFNISTISMATRAVQSEPRKQSSTIPIIPHGPLGLPSKFTGLNKGLQDNAPAPKPASPDGYKETPTSLLDRLAARDRAYGLLTALTKLGTGWNRSEAWFALARAYEEGGQPDKAREVLWWCVELEESRGVRDWVVVSSGGYVL